MSEGSDVAVLYQGGWKMEDMAVFVLAIMT